MTSGSTRRKSIQHRAKILSRTRRTLLDSSVGARTWPLESSVLGSPSVNAISPQKKTAPPASSAFRILEVHPQGRWFAVDEGSRIDTSPYGNVCRALTLLTKEHVARPGTAVIAGDLVRHIWPDQTILESAARNRLRVTIAKLRKAGLDDLLVTADAGYRLAHGLVVRVSKEIDRTAESAPALS